MTNKDLRLFLHLTETLNFSRTSSKYFVSPASLTRIIQRLEQETGARLFERDNRTVKLTASGALFRHYAAESLERWQALKSSLHIRGESLRGNVSVFCSVTASYHYLQELLDNYRQLYPEVEIHLHTGDSAQALQRIKQGQEEIGIAALPDKLPASLQFEALGESPLVFIAPTSACPLKTQLDNYRHRAENLPWAEIPMVLSETGLSRGRLDAWFRQRAIKPNVYAQVGGNEAIVSMVSLGLGMGVVPQIVMENSPLCAKVEIWDIKPELKPFVIGLCVLKRKLTNPLIRAFWDLGNRAAVKQDKRVSSV